MKYIVHAWRYFQLDKHEFDSLEEAVQFAGGSQDHGMCYVEQITSADGSEFYDHGACNELERKYRPYAF